MLGLLTNSHVMGQNSVENNVQQFVVERLVFDAQGQFSAIGHKTMVASEANLGLLVNRRLYAYASTGMLWRLDETNGIRSFHKASTVGGGLGYRLIDNPAGRASLDWRIALSQGIGKSSLSCTVYDSQVRLRFGGKVLVPTIGVGFKHLHSHATGLKSHNYLYATIGIGL